MPCKSTLWFKGQWQGQLNTTDIINTYLILSQKPVFRKMFTFGVAVDQVSP
jgi:hypothetical protein